MKRWVDEQMDRWIDVEMDRCRDGQMQRWIDGQMDRQIDEFGSCVKKLLIGFWQLAIKNMKNRSTISWDNKLNQ